MYIAAGRNNLYARQGRSIANQYADETRELFAQDAALSDEYNHKLLNGRWNHMMDQTHIGYTFWNEPPVNAMPAVQQVQPLAGAHMLVFPENSAPFRPALPAFDSINRQTWRIELANRGTATYEFTATPSAPWIHLSKTTGTVDTGARLDVTIDWNQLPAEDNTGNIVITQQGHDAEHPVTIQIEATRPSSPTINGFIEDNGVIAIEAEHFTTKRNAAKVSWEKLPGFGETLSAVTPFPTTADSDDSPSLETSACLDYQLYLFRPGNYKLETVLAPTLAFVPGRGLRFALSIDKQPLTPIDIWSSNSPTNTPDWDKAVSDGVRRISIPVTIDHSGPHTLHLCMVDPAVVVERLILRAKPAQPPSPRSPIQQESYLGPVESTYIPLPTATPAFSLRK
ncbi:MAG: hypothetical protein WDN23_06745 [Edaphobacter sp.]